MWSKWNQAVCWFIHWGSSEKRTHRWLLDVQCTSEYSYLSIVTWDDWFIIVILRADTLHNMYMYAAAAVAKSLQSCPTLCDPIDNSPPRSPVPGILQARVLEWVAISFSNAWKWKVKVKLLSRFQLLATTWSAAYQAPPSMGFSRQEYWSGVPLPSPI